MWEQTNHGQISGLTNRDVYKRQRYLKSALQAHPDAGYLWRYYAGTGRWTAEGAEPAGYAQMLHRPSRCV